MKYCTNCGKDISGKICSHCGVKQNKTHLFCAWCGTAINANAALEVFHSEVALKNEASFVLNDSTVSIQKDCNGEEEACPVTVYLDYSAQNGFGGMVRDTYKVELIFNHVTGKYSRR